MPDPLTDATLLDAITDLTGRDPRQARIVADYGPPPLWAREPGFPTLVHIILEQQVSLASAKAAFDRLLNASAGRIVAGDLGVLDAGWITEDQLVGLTGQSVAPKLYLALGIDGDTSQFMATQEAGMIIAVQPDPAAPFVPVADYNVIADPAEFAGRAAQRSDPRLTRPQNAACPRAMHLFATCSARLLAGRCLCQCLLGCARIGPRGAS